MKSVLISIQPKWCALIANGKKTIEVRKTRPSLETPFKCYIYCTKQGRPLVYGQFNPCAPECYQQTFGYSKQDAEKIFGNLQGKVIGEFVCNKVKEFTPCAVRLCGLDYNICVSDFFATCLTDKELNEYGKDKPLYGWHISDLKIYDKPKELGEFTVMRKCTSCKDSGYESGACAYDENCMIPVPIEKVPQSWQFIYKE